MARRPGGVPVPREDVVTIGGGAGVPAMVCRLLGDERPVLRVSLLRASMPAAVLAAEAAAAAAAATVAAAAALAAALAAAAAAASAGAVPEVAGG